MVSRGDQIGKLGSTGRSTGAHVHYEVRKNGKALDPAKYLGY
jgi:murein DD-endopeptidase MepM/ murein hydrolase activator NlpD